MKLYYKKKENEGFRINVENTKSDFKIITGDKNRLKMIYKNNTIFWAKIDRFYDGVWFIIGNYGNYFPHIKSFEIEKRKNLTDLENLYSWGKFFIEKLKEINFFYEGVWHLNFYHKDEKYRKFLHYGTGESIYDFDKTFDFNKCRYLDWNGEDNRIILNIKPKKNIDNGRIKWWRKKIREDNLPPILLLFIPALDAYIILDGHDRYQASILENKLPSLLVLNPVKKIIVKEDQNRKESILNSLKETTKKMPINKLNNLLISIYGDKEFYERNFIAQGVLGFEKIWEEEIKKELENHEDLEDILDF